LFEQTPVITLSNATVRYNMATEKIDNIKEYTIKFLKRQLMFKEFFALTDINLTINRGESWGVIGRNGAGKSTLLKLICGILAPFTGTVSVSGTIAPLIELGAGFDGRLTARENILLNGAILGHNRALMRENTEKVLDFAELNEFSDIPIKNYSSGMYARLGFALATLFKPDILILDEVLAVGDIAFKKKCDIRIKELLADETTLLFVSHSGSSVREMCGKALWLEKGKIMMTGTSNDVCGAYEEKYK